MQLKKKWESILYIELERSILSLKKQGMALTGVAQLLGRESPRVLFLVRGCAQVVGSVPGWGTYKKQPIDVSLPLSPALPSL